MRENIVKSCILCEVNKLNIQLLKLKSVKTNIPDLSLAKNLNRHFIKENT